MIGVWEYAKLLSLMTPLAIFHAPVPPTSALAVAALASLGALYWIAVVWRRRFAFGLFGLTWFLAFLLPGMWVGSLVGDTAIAEHRLYLPAVGGFLILGSLCAEATPFVTRFRSARLLAPLALLSMVLMLSGRTMLRNMTWSDPVALWTEAERLAPTHWLPPTLKAEELHRSARHAEAIREFRRSLALHPANDGAAIDLVICLAELGRQDEAQAVIADRLRENPSSVFGDMGRGAVAAIGGHGEEARVAFRSVVDRDPSNVMARQWLALLAEASNDRAEALHRCYELQRLIPGRESIASCIERFRFAPEVTRP
jgi:tetratricopeptide (TPR) repeat protein